MGEPRPLAKAASLRKAEVGTSSAQLTTDKHRVCKACSPCPARSPREFSQGCTESSPRGSVLLPEIQLLQMLKDDILGERTLTFRQSVGCVSDTWSTLASTTTLGKGGGATEVHGRQLFFKNQIP